jgi:dihydropteroate synthase
MKDSLVPGTSEQGYLICGSRRLNLDRPAVMGILNVTPDSFSDGGVLGTSGGRESAGFLVSAERALRAAAQMVGEGADIVDVGGESTRPGSEAVSVQQELDRVLPVIEAISRNLDVLVSVDTSSPQVMTEAAAAGASLINDIRALQRPGALQAAADSGLAVCLMHMQGDPSSMQKQPVYQDVVSEVAEFLADRLRVCIHAGIGRERLCVDPGFGFGKTVEHNYQLLAALPELIPLGVPLLVGMSRKSMIGAVTERSVHQRVHGSVAAAVFAALSGARIIRVHDVGATVDAMKVLQAAQKYTNRKQG